jgi:nitrogen fixation/metabolism regulation signal transduction histidine kinase
MLGKTERRLALVILLTAIIPLAVAVVFASSMLDYAKSKWLQPEVATQLQRGIDLYGAYIAAVKDDMKHQADAMAGDEALRGAARRRDGAACERVLDGLLPRYGRLVSLAVEEEDGRSLCARDRGKPLDEATERKLEVRRPLGVDVGGPTPTLLVTFAFDRSYEKQLEQAGLVQKGYEDIRTDPDLVYRPVYEAFALLLGITAVATVVLGFLLARGVTRRINRLANAINQVAAGDLDVRVPVTGSDELTELARVFNRMLSEMQQSRARIEYLQRIGAWQEMAQRLAHEIKNPLTPIQLAVQECHRKYAGDDAKFRGLLDTTLEIVEEEVGTLRRLVGNFSSFARLPHADLRDASLRDFLRECSEQLGHLGAELSEEGSEDVVVTHDVDVHWELSDDPMLVAIDRQMLRRVLVNLVRNAVEAIRGARPAAASGAPRGHVLVHAERTRDGFGFAIIIEDDGPGVPEAARERVFDPYFTTKPEGTGLGLAIVKKVVVEHNGSITVRRGDRLGGAAFVVSLPLPHSLAIAAAQGEGGGNGNTTAGPTSARPSRRAIPSRG